MRTETAKTTHATHTTKASHHAPATAAAGPPPTPEPMPAVTPAPASPSPATPVPAAALILIGLPPPDANIPSPPKGWTPRPGEDYRGTQPRKAELSTVANALEDLARFTDYAQVLGSTVPPLDHVLLLLQAAAAWSTMRGATASWDVFSQAQEGLAWGAVREVMTPLRSAFDLAATANKSLATRLPSLVSFLDAQKVIARKGASTRAANKTDIQAGKLPTHGKVGKARKRAAANAALEAQTATAGATQETPTPAQPAQPAAAAAAPQPQTPATTGALPKA